MKDLNFQNREEALEFAYNNCPFEIPTIEWEEETGYFFEGIDEEMKSNIQNWTNEKSNEIWI